MQRDAFTLFEIIITIILISIVYIFAINSFPQTQKTVEDTQITFTNLKKTLFEFSYEDNINIKCIANDFSCFVFIDGIMQDDKIDPFFTQAPVVYEYNNELTQIEFDDLELEQLESYNIVFDFVCKKNKKCDEYIVQTKQDIYIYKNLQDEPSIIGYISDIDQYFNNKIQKVKNAF